MGLTERVAGPDWVPAGLLEPTQLVSETLPLWPLDRRRALQLAAGLLVLMLFGGLVSLFGLGVAWLVFVLTPPSPSLRSERMRKAARVVAVVLAVWAIGLRSLDLVVAFGLVDGILLGGACVGLSSVSAALVVMPLLLTRVWLRRALERPVVGRTQVIVAVTGTLLGVALAAWRAWAIGTAVPGTWLSAHLQFSLFWAAASLGGVVHNLRRQTHQARTVRSWMDGVSIGPGAVADRPWGLEVEGAFDGVPVTVALVDVGWPPRVFVRVPVTNLDPQVHIRARRPTESATIRGDALLERFVAVVGGDGVARLVDGRHAAVLPVIQGRPGSCVVDGNVLLVQPIHVGPPSNWPSPDELVAEATVLARALSRP